MSRTSTLQRPEARRAGHLAEDADPELRSVERDGLITRAVRPTNPPQVEYALSDLGETLLPPVAALIDWAEAHQSRIVEARRQFDSSPRQTAAAANCRR